MPTIITGNTFAYRDLLKRTGFRWVAPLKHWVCEAKLSSAEIYGLEQLWGITVRTDQPSAPPPQRYKPSPAAAEPELDPDRPPIIIGNSQRWFNYTAPPRRLFHGFSSLYDYSDYVETTRQDGIGWRDDPWREKAGTSDMSEALHLARHGWPEGAEAARLVSDHLLAARPDQRRAVWAVSGGSVNVGKMLAGDPRHMRSRVKLPGKKIITIFVSGTFPAKIKPEILLARAAAIAGFCDMMEKTGYQCEIVLTISTRGSDEKDGVNTVIDIKSAGERVNLSDLSFALGHPSILRRFEFACISQNLSCLGGASRMGFIGYEFASSEHKLKKNEIYFPQLGYNIYHTVEDMEPLDMALTILAETEIRGITKDEY